MESAAAVLRTGTMPRTCRNPPRQGLYRVESKKRRFLYKKMHRCHFSPRSSRVDRLPRSSAFPEDLQARGLRKHFSPSLEKRLQKGRKLTCKNSRILFLNRRRLEVAAFACPEHRGCHMGRKAYGKACYSLLLEAVIWQAQGMYLGGQTCRRWLAVSFFLERGPIPSAKACQP